MPKLSLSSRLLCLSFVPACALSLFAQSTPPALGGGPFSSTIEDLRAASAAMPQDHQFEAQILLEEGTYKIGDDGTLSYQHRMVYRVDSPEAVQRWSEISAGWDP